MPKVASRPTLDPRATDLTGKPFGRWKVLGYAGNKISNGRSRLMWTCLCRCGTFKEILGDNLTGNKTLSCGCWRSEKASVTSAKHGFSRVGKRIPEYKVWCGIIQRCTNQNYPKWKDYGGRGITICERWRDFPNFYKDIGPRPTPKHTVERINNEKGYEPGNVEWATKLVQGNNKRNNRLITFQGKTLTVSQWSRELNLPYFTLMYRIKNGWTAEETLTTPVRPITR
jgi:hypothetical protein